MTADHCRTRSFARRTAPSFMLMAWLLVAAQGTPCVSTPVGAQTVARWSDGATLTVLIDRDPASTGRDQLAAEGLRRWIPRLQQRGLDLQVQLKRAGQPAPADAIRLEWKSKGFKSPYVDQPIDPPSCMGIGEYTYDGDRVIYRASIYMWDGIDVDQPELVRNVAEHEMVHVLGLPDCDVGCVSNHIQPLAIRDWNDADEQLLDDVYPVQTP